MESSDYSNCPKNVVGCGGYKTFTIKSLKPGRTKLKLTYLSHDDLVDRQIVYDIEVDDNYIIHESHKEYNLE